jgi:hypothetical protein
MSGRHLKFNARLLFLEVLGGGLVPKDAESMGRETSLCSISAANNTA